MPGFWICRDFVNNIIIIVTNVITLEFLPAQFAYPGALQLTTLSLFLINTSQNIRITKANELFFLTKMTLEFSKYLNKTAGSIFKSETTKMKLEKTYQNIQKLIFKQKCFVQRNILSNTCVIQFLKISYIHKR